jgi:hypothetical protein
MPVDRGEIRRLAKDPDAIAVIRTIDLYFERMAERRDTEPGLAAATAEAIIEVCCKLMKRGIMASATPRPTMKMARSFRRPLRRASAPVLASSAKLFAIRRHLRRVARSQDAKEPGEPGASG